MREDYRALPAVVTHSAQSNMYTCHKCWKESCAGGSDGDLYTPLQRLSLIRAMIYLYELKYCI